MDIDGRYTLDAFAPTTNPGLNMNKPMNKPKIDIRFNSEKKVMNVFVNNKDVNVSFHIGGIKGLKLHDICRAFKIDHYGKLAHKNMYQEFSEKMGMGPKYFKKILEASVYREVIAPRKDVVRFYCMRKDGISFHALSKFLQLEDVYTTAYNDAKRGVATNVIPAIWQSGRDTKWLKETLGKSLWKKICKCSKNKNSILFSEYRSIDQIKESVNYPVSVLRAIKAYGACSAAFTDILLRMRGYVASFNRLSDYHRILFADCCTMSRDVEIPLDFTIVKNSPNDPESIRQAEERINAIHHDLVRKINAQKDKKSEEPYKFEDGVPNIFNFNGVVATRINSPHELQTEGSTMHHCVGSYSDIIREGRYLVYHLEDGVERATLGINVLDVEKSNSSAKYKVDQMYGVCNRPVESDRIKKAQEMLLKQLNSIKEK